MINSGNLDLALAGLFSMSDSVKKMTAGTVTRPAPPTTAPESICSSSLEMVATERSELWKIRIQSAYHYCQARDPASGFHSNFKLMVRLKVKTNLSLTLNAIQSLFNWKIFSMILAGSHLRPGCDAGWSGFV